MKKEIEKFVEACVMKGVAEKIGDSKKGNKQYKIIQAVYLSLKSNTCLHELLDLLDHENPYVRLWAASYTLQISPLEAEKALKALMDTKGSLVGFSAEVTLHEWKNGRLKLE